MPRQINPASLRYKLATAALRLLYGKAPRWHFYPVPQASVGAFVICLQSRDDGYRVALTQRGGAVENAGMLSVTFGGFVELMLDEQPAAAAVREANEESAGALMLDKGRVRLVHTALQYHEHKHWHTDHTTLAVGHYVVLTADEVAALEGVQSDETAHLIWAPLKTVLDEYGARIAYPAERAALEKLVARYG